MPIIPPPPLLPFYSFTQLCLGCSAAYDDVSALAAPEHEYLGGYTVGDVATILNRYADTINEVRRDPPPLFAWILFLPSLFSSFPTSDVIF